MARIPSDPAQVIVNHASFRVQLGAASGRALGLDETARIPVVPAGVTAGRRRPAPVVWSGSSAPGDPLAGELQEAVRAAGIGLGAGAAAGAATQVLPRIDDTTVMPPVPAMPTVVGQRAAAEPPTGLLSGVRPTRGAYDPLDDEAGGPDEPAVGYTGSTGEEPDTERWPRDRRGDPAKHAWYPDRRLNLGIVLLPLRVLLGFISIYAGMGKLCDRVYFDGGSRGSMVTWLASLHPWGLAEPLRDAALNHPVGAGLSIAFLQVVVGVLTVCGLWQRVAAVFGATLSIALLVTVSWRTVPVYDAPDFIYLAAWSPLIIAGAPVYSIDAHLANDAWRRLGPRVSVWDLRRRVLRRGAVLTSVIAGVALLVGSVLGAAVRATSTHDDLPVPAVTPTNNLPGAPLPEVSGSAGATDGASPEPSRSAAAKQQEQQEQATQAPSSEPPSNEEPSGSGGGTDGGGSSESGTPAGSDTDSGSGSGDGGPDSGSSSGGSGQAPSAPSAPVTEAPAPPPPTAKPPQGAIGGLLGSHSPTGLLLGMEPGGTGGGPQGGA